MRFNHIMGSALFPLACFACSGAESESNEMAEAGYDLELLEEHRSAIPDEEQVQVVVPGPSGEANALTRLGNAELAGLAISSAVQVNLPAKVMVGLLRRIVKVKPTLYDSEKKQFVWGPWKNDDGHGDVLVYIQENEPNADFRFSYAFVRIAGNDVSTGAPVIWGAGTPDRENARYGVGVTLWDFEANNAFEAEHDPDYAANTPREQGRFAQLYGRDQGDDGEFTFNVSVFRNFMPDDAGPNDSPADLDYFFGRFEGNDGNRYDFLDWQLDADLCDATAESCFENNTVDDVREPRHWTRGSCGFRR
jgi:hypothetical protein